jgi:hypothetical protein
MHSVKSADIAELAVSILKYCQSGTDHRDNNCSSGGLSTIHRLNALLLGFCCHSFPRLDVLGKVYG